MADKSSNFLSSVERLKGRENYATWKFAMKTYLEYIDHWKAVLGSETDDKKITKARTAIILGIDPSNYVHVEGATTAKEVWEKLQTMFEDKGRARRITLVKQLTGTKLEDCVLMDCYVSTIITAAHRLNAIGFPVSDEWLAIFLMCGLTEQYTPMVMALDNTETKLSSDAIKTKLLQEIPLTSNENAFFNSNKKSQRKSKGIRCYTCNKKGHKSTECTKKKDNKNKKDSNDSGGKSGATFSAVFFTGNFNKGDWYIDSGATQHLTINRNWVFNEKKPLISDITAANKIKMKVESSGNVKLLAEVKGEPSQIEVNDVLCIPELAANLLSVSQMTSRGYEVHFFADCAEIRDKKGNLVAMATMIDGLYRLNGMKQCSYIAVAATDSSETWHRRLGHLNYHDLNKMKTGAVDGISFVNDSGEHVCVTCCKGKHSRQPFSKQGSRAEQLLDIIHADLAGPTQNASLGGARYALVLVDDFSRMTFTFFLKSKDEAYRKFCEFKTYVENQTGKRVKKFRSDNGTEFCNQQFEKFFKSCGIERQTTTPYTPQQNGLAERTIRTLTERARCMLQDANLPKKFWAEAFGTATYLKNRSVSRVLGRQTPIEIWTGSRPNLSHLRIFGSRAMVHIPDERRKKFDAKSRELIFVGYSEGTKGYRMYDSDTNRVINSRDVIFLETSNSSNLANNISALHEIDNSEENDTVVEHQYDADVVAKSGEVKNNVSTTQTHDGSDGTDITNVSIQPTNNDEPILRRSKRVIKPINLSDYVTYYAGSNIDEPFTVDEAMAGESHQHWKHAMNEEYQSLMDSRTWGIG